MSSNPVEQGSEAASPQENILENIPRSYRKAWARMTPSQRAEACEAIFTDRQNDKKKPQASVLTEISKHRGWSNGMQFKEIARNLSPADKGQACFEVA